MVASEPKSYDEVLPTHPHALVFVDIATALEMNLLRFVGFKMLTNAYKHTAQLHLCMYVYV